MPQPNYGDVTYSQSYSNTFHQKVESTKYDAALAIAGAIGGSSTEKTLLRILTRTVMV